MGYRDSHEIDPTVEAPFTAGVSWKAGAIAGFAATFVSGVLITVVNPSMLATAIAGLYGAQGSLAVGWLAHLAHGTVFGVLFAVILSDPGLYRVSEWFWKSVVAGVVYGLVLAVAAAGFVMPVWLTIVGFPTPPQLPFVTVPLVGVHIVYGAVLGGVFPFVEPS